MRPIYFQDSKVIVTLGHIQFTGRIVGRSTELPEANYWLVRADCPPISKDYLFDTVSVPDSAIRLLNQDLD